MSATLTNSALWIRRFHSAHEAAPRLVCLPHAGGSASFYFPMSKTLSPHIEVLTIQYPGRQDRRLEPCVEDIGDLADLICAALEQSGDRDRPLSLFGHSMGATLAFEVAVRLEREKRPATRLFLSGRRAACRYRAETVHLRDYTGLMEELRLLEGMDLALLKDPDALAMVLPSIRSDYTAIESYLAKPGVSVSCPVTVLTGDRDPKTTLDEAEDWRRHTTGPFELRVFEGGHFFLVDHASEVLRLVSERILQTGNAARVPRSPRNGRA